MPHSQNVRATDSTGTSEFTYSGTGVSVKDGGINLAGGAPVAGTITGATLASPVITGTPNLAGATGVPVTKTVSFTEATQAGAGVYSGAVDIPAGATILALQVVVTALFDDGTSASLDVGDTDDPDGFFQTVNVKATDLVVGEVLDISNAENWGATQGAYLVAATGRKGSVAAGNSGIYYGVATQIIGLLTVGAGNGTAGRAFMTVTYAVGSVTAATFSA